MRKLYIFVSLLGILLGAYGFASGSWQVGLTQALFEYDSSAVNFATATHPQFVIFNAATEVMNVSLCGRGTNDNLRFEVRSLNGAPLYYTSPTIVKETETGFCGFTATTYPTALNPPAGFKWSPAANNPPLPAGTYQLRLYNDSQSGGAGLLNRFDITVTANTATNPNPKLAAGRVFAYNWAYSAGGFTQDKSTDAKYYILVPGGRPNTNYVWQLDLNKFAGFGYDLVANDKGVNAANVLYSVPQAGNSVTEKYPMYLGYPVSVLPPPTLAPQLSEAYFIDSDVVDQTISPGGTVGVQDTGTFRFRSDVEGRYLVIIDANQNSTFGDSIVVNGSEIDDVYLFGPMSIGNNSVVWNGRDNRGTLLPNGVYNAEIEGRIGEYHFVASDAETSGGGVQNGLTIFGVKADMSLYGVPVFWDDLTGFNPDKPGNGGSTLPKGRLSVPGQATGNFRHTWGSFTNSSFGDSAFVDTYVYGLAGYASASAVIASDDEPGQELELVKEVRNVTRAGTFATTGTGLPGDVLEYRVTFLGRSSTSYKVVLQDMLPPYTTLELDQYGAGEVQLTCPGAAPKQLDFAVASPNYGVVNTGSSSGATLKIVLTGSDGTTNGGVCVRAKLVPGESGTLLFRVRIQ